MLNSPPMKALNTLCEGVFSGFLAEKPSILAENGCFGGDYRINAREKFSGSPTNPELLRSSIDTAT